MDSNADLGDFEGLDPIAGHDEDLMEDVQETSAVDNAPAQSQAEESKATSSGSKPHPATAASTSLSHLRAVAPSSPTKATPTDVATETHSTPSKAIQPVVEKPAASPVNDSAASTLQTTAPQPLATPEPTVSFSTPSSAIQQPSSVILQSTEQPVSTPTTPVRGPAATGSIAETPTPFLGDLFRTPGPLLAAKSPTKPFVDEEKLRRVLKLLSMDDVADSLMPMLESVPDFAKMMARVDAVMCPKLMSETSEEALRNKISVLEAEKLAMEAEVEARAHSLEIETRVMRLKVKKLTAANEDQNTKIESLNKALEAEKKSASSSKERTDATQKEISTLKTTIAELESDKRNLATVVSAKNEEIEGYLRDVARLRLDLDASRTEIKSLSDQVSSLQAEESKNRLERLTKDQESDHLKRNVEWLNEELGRKTEEFKAYRHEKTEALNKLQNDFEQVLQERNSLEIQSQGFKSKAEISEARLLEITEKLKDTENRLISTEQSFKNEMSAQKKLSDLYHAQSEDLRSQLQELQAVVTEMELKVQEENASKLEASEAAKAQIQTLQKEIEEKDFKIEELTAQIKSIDGKVSASVDQLGILSPAAQAATKLQKSGKTFTEIYAEYTRLQDEKILANREIARLTECLNHILNELSERAPVIQQFKIDKENAERESARLSEELISALRLKDEAVSTAKSYKEQIDALEAQNNILQKESYDLARQVQHLLLEVENLRAGPGGLSKSPTKLSLDEDPGAATASGRVISERLVVFNNIVELQSQNQKLRASLRTVSDALDKEKADIDKKIEEKTKEEVMEATALMEELREQLRVANMKCGSYVRERDQWKRIAESRGLAGSPLKSGSRPGTPTPATVVDNTPSQTSMFEQMYKDLQRDFDALRKESGTDTKLLKEANEALMREKSDLNVQIARLNSTLEYQNERYRTISQNIDIQTKENSQLRERISSLIKNLSVQESKTQELSNQLVEARLSLDSAQTEARQLRGEKEVLKSSEARALAENQGLLQQRNMANEHLKSLQKMFDELDRHAKEASAKAEEKVARLDKDLESARQQLSNALEETRVLSSKRELETKDAQIKIERLKAEVSDITKDRDVALAEAKGLQDRVQDLVGRLASAEERANIFEAKASQTGEAAQVTDKIKDLHADLSQTKSELESTKENLKLEKERVEQYKAIASSCEEKLLEFTSTYDQYREEMDKKLQESESMVAMLEKSRGDLEERLHRTVTEITELQEKSDTDRASFEAEKMHLTSVIERLQSLQDNAFSQMDSLRKELLSKDKRLAEARSDYERVIIAEADRIKLLQEVEGKLRASKSEANELKSRAASAESNLKSAQKSWEEIKVKLESQMESLQKTNDDLVEQNKILHGQFESISTRISALKESNAVQEGETATAAGADTESDKNLSEVIRYLRREKDILEREQEVSAQKLLRLQQQTEHLQKSLDETRAVLDSEREKGQASADSTKMHAELLEKIDSLNILRESNSTLRSQNEVSTKRIKLLEQRIKDKEAELGPLKEENGSLKAELEAKRIEMKTLEEDNGRWKARTQQILAKYERIDPVEHQRLKDNVSTLAEELKASQAKVAELTNDAAVIDGQIASLTSQLDDVNGKLLASTAEINRLQTESKVAEKEIERLNAKLLSDEEEAKKSRKDIIDKSNGTILKFKERNSRLITQVQELSAQKEALEAQIAKLVDEKTNSQALLLPDMSKLQQLESQIAQYKQKEAQYEDQVKQLEAALLMKSITTPAQSSEASKALAPDNVDQAAPPTLAASSEITPSPSAKRQREEETALSTITSSSDSSFSKSDIHPVQDPADATHAADLAIQEPSAKRLKVDIAEVAEDGALESSLEFNGDIDQTKLEGVESDGLLEATNSSVSELEKIVEETAMEETQAKNTATDEVPTVAGEAFGEPIGDIMEEPEVLVGDVADNAISEPMVEDTGELSSQTIEKETQPDLTALPSQLGSSEVENVSQPIPATEPTVKSSPSPVTTSTLPASSAQSPIGTSIVPTSQALPPSDPTPATTSAIPVTQASSGPIKIQRIPVVPMMHFAETTASAVNSPSSNASLSETLTSGSPAPSQTRPEEPVDKIAAQSSPAANVTTSAAPATPTPAAPTGITSTPVMPGPMVQAVPPGTPIPIRPPMGAGRGDAAARGERFQMQRQLMMQQQQQQQHQILSNQAAGNMRPPQQQKQGIMQPGIMGRGAGMIRGVPQRGRGGLRGSPQAGRQIAGQQGRIPSPGGQPGAGAAGSQNAGQ
ncbi:hypothetical protein HDV05_006557 [Chytridiales sp. JEL 0842]|nr:hypothetical protein HDV05_006557 [Chytridiales sp. JEL 0842]